MSEATAAAHHEEEPLEKAYDMRLMRRLISYLRPYRGRVALAVFLLFAGSFTELAGPYLNDEGKPCGSMLIVEADNFADARAFGEEDPYCKAGLFQSVDVRAWRVAVGTL